jgi:hypothetical protein
MTFVRRGSYKKALGGNARSGLFGTTSLGWLSLCVLLWGIPSLARSQQKLDAPETNASTGEHATDNQPLGNISGTIVDQSGAPVAGVRVLLTREDQSSNQEVLSDSDGQFSLANIAPGLFQLIVTSVGFATQTSSGTLPSGENFSVPLITLAIATKETEVRVGLAPSEVAEGQIKDQEKQRVLGFIPNFNVSYIPNAAPLTPKQKFELAWKTETDPVTFGLVAAISGIQQATNEFSGYRQGAEGYAKRYAAVYTGSVTGTLIGGAILPSLLKQDPRYFYKGSGSRRSRILYAIATSVICRGDNGHWQANYSGILGSLAANGIANLYYPQQNRNGAALTFENLITGIGTSSATNLLQEFLIRKLTPNLPKQQPAKP